MAALLLLAGSSCGFAQSAPRSNADQGTFTLAVPVNEVKVTFHAADPKGVPLEHLRKSDINLSDNRKPQKRLVAFHEYRDLPIRVGFLIDNSPSMLNELDRSQAIARELTTDFFRPGSDRAFTMGFGMDADVTQDWIADSGSVSNGISAALSKKRDGPDGTALFDAIYKACKDKFSAQAAELTGNFILLFTDGEENSSKIWKSQAVDMCQRARTAIYIFMPELKVRENPAQQLLQELAAETGGRVFYERKQAVHDALATTVSDMRYQYELIYAPQGLKRDGSFHQIKVRCRVPHSQVQARSGYYAYGH